MNQISSSNTPTTYVPSAYEELRSRALDTAAEVAGSNAPVTEDAAHEVINEFLLKEAQETLDGLVAAGMPKSVADDFMAKLRAEFGPSGTVTKEEVDHARTTLGPGLEQAFGDISDAVTQTLKDDLEAEHKKDNKFDGEGKSTGKKGGLSGKSWVVAIAMALGEAMGNKAVKIMQLSEQVADLAGKTEGLSAPVGTKLGAEATQEQRDNQTALETVNAQDREQNAKAFHLASAELKGTNGEYTMLGELVNSTTKTFTDALAGLARK